MSLEAFAPSCAIVLCSYDRHVLLRETLHSIATQDFDRSLLVIVVEAGEPAPLRSHVYPFALEHIHYQDLPSAARQRNAGLDRLPTSIEYVFFLDDDITLRPGYLRTLAHILDEHEEIGGAGGVMLGEEHLTDRSLLMTIVKHFFLLSHLRPGRVLPSGNASYVQTDSTTTRTRTEFLGTGSSVYRRLMLERHRFDENLLGRSLFEDRDLSYRISQETALVVEPRAKVVHHSQHVQRDARSNVATVTIHRYWLVEKCIRHPLRKPAYWWATLGQALAILTSSKPEKWEALRGLWQGVHAVWRRSHPLLRDHGIVNNTDRLAA